MHLKDVFLFFLPVARKFLYLNYIPKYFLYCSVASINIVAEALTDKQSYF